jgi:hypothetical protein
MKNNIFLQFILLFFFLLTNTGLVNAEFLPHLEYKISECKKAAVPLSRSDWYHEEAPIEEIPGSAAIRHKQKFYCAANFKVELTNEKNILRLLISEDSKAFAQCTCTYNIDIYISKLPEGLYAVEVWGVKNKMLEEPSLRKSLGIEIDSKGTISIQTNNILE